jgi:hypothetical protein
MDNLEKNLPTDTKSDEDYKKLLNSVSPWKIILPIVLGLGLVAYMLISNFDAEEFKKITMTAHTYFWIAMAAVFVGIRHLCYMIRLRVVTEGQFSWRKCFDLIVIWEFSSALTPTSVGGSAVSMFVISREQGMTAGRTVMIVLYTVVVDTFFFLIMLLIFFAIFGARAIFPGCNSLGDLLNHGWATAFLGAYAFMFAYGSLVFYGVIVNGNALRRVLLGLFSLPLLNRFKKGIASFTSDMVAASTQMSGKGWKFHLGAIGATAGAWMSRFMVLNCLILAFVTFSDNPTVKAHYDDLMTGELNYNIVTQQVFIYAREQAMYVLMAVIPSPGAAGGAEFAFLAFHSDYLPAPQLIDGKEVIPTLSIIISTIWRLLTFYSYLIFGAIVVPRWVASLVAKPVNPVDRDV